MKVRGLPDDHTEGAVVWCMFLMAGFALSCMLCAGITSYSTQMDVLDCVSHVPA